MKREEVKSIDKADDVLSEISEFKLRK